MLVLKYAFKITFLSLYEHEKSVILCVSLPLRLLGRFGKGLHLRAFDGHEISKADLGSTAGPDRYTRRSAACGLSETQQ